MKNLAVIVMAAGQGTRMKSNMAKVLHSICGWPLICHVVARTTPLKPEKLVMVVERQASEVKNTVYSCMGKENVTFAEQKEQLGTGHAVMSARKNLSGFNGDVLILSGDVPLLSTRTMKDFISAHRRKRHDLTVMTFRADAPAGYGRILQGDKGELLGVVEERDATHEQKLIDEVNAGIYVVKSKLLFKLLAKLGRDNDQGEYYLTDIIAMAAGGDEKCGVFEAMNPAEVMGINTRSDLAQADEILRMSILDVLMDGGVTVMDPRSTYVEIDVSIGRDTVLYPNVAIREGSRIGDECVIKSGSQIARSIIDDKVELKAYSIVEDSRLEAGTIIGPFARLRSRSHIQKDASVETFVELYETKVGERSKIRRLCYLGDADIGAETIVGAGVITCNFDGSQINRSKVGRRVYVGSDSQLIAPLDIGDRAHVASGSTVTRDIPDDSLYVTRGDTTLREGWMKTRRSEIMSTKDRGKPAPAHKKRVSKSGKRPGRR